MSEKMTEEDWASLRIPPLEERQRKSEETLDKWGSLPSRNPDYEYPYYGRNMGRRNRRRVNVIQGNVPESLNKVQ